MIELSEETMRRVSAMFDSQSLGEAVELLQNDCADNLPFFESSSAVDLERVRFAALKLSHGNIEALVEAIALAQTDWRDLLVAAGFAEDVNAHRLWEPGQN